MRQRSPHHLKSGRLSTLLLAGTAAVCLGDATRAEPIQSFWLTPTMMASGLGGIEKTEAGTQLKTLRAKAFEKRQVNLLTPVPEPMWGSLGAQASSEDEPLPFSDTPGEDQPISVKLRGGAFDLEPSVNAKVGRLADGANFGSVPAQSVGFDVELVNGRFAFSSDVVKPIDQTDNRDYRDLQLRETRQTMSLADTSRRHRFAAKVIDTENLRLMFDGEFGHTSEGFANSLRELPTGDLILPGSWSTLTSSIEFRGAKLSVDYQDWTTREKAQQRQGLTLGFASSAMSVYRKEGMEFNLTQGGQWLKRTSFTGINADVIVADLLPDAVADAIDPIRRFLPTSIAGGFERGDVVRSELLPGPRDRVSTGSVAMTWDTDFGETTASFWERRINTDIVGIGEEKIPLGRSRDRFIDVAHKVRSGNWQFGAGLSLIETDDTIGASDQHMESEIAPHVSIAYAPENGPKVELRFGAADAQSQIIDDNLAARAKTKQLQLSVDLSNFAQDELNKPDAKLKLEYRYDLNGSDRDPVSGRERGGGHALLLTFSTPLN